MKLFEVKSPIKGSRAYLTDTRCSIIYGIEQGRHHLSISHPDRYPTWDEIRDARYAIMPDEITVAMFLPPKKDYVNVNENTFHLWETIDK